MHDMPRRIYTEAHRRSGSTFATTLARDLDLSGHWSASSVRTDRAPAISERGLNTRRDPWRGRTSAGPAAQRPSRRRLSRFSHRDRRRQEMTGSTGQGFARGATRLGQVQLLWRRSSSASTRLCSPGADAYARRLLRTRGARVRRSHRLSRDAVFHDWIFHSRHSRWYADLSVGPSTFSPRTRARSARGGVSRRVRALQRRSGLFVRQMPPTWPETCGRDAGRRPATSASRRAGGHRVPGRWRGRRRGLHRCGGSSAAAPGMEARAPIRGHRRNSRSGFATPRRAATAIRTEELDRRPPMRCSDGPPRCGWPRRARKAAWLVQTWFRHGSGDSAGRRRSSVKEQGADRSVSRQMGRGGLSTGASRARKKRDCAIVPGALSRATSRAVYIVPLNYQRAATSPTAVYCRSGVMVACGEPGPPVAHYVKGAQFQVSRRRRRAIIATRILYDDRLQSRP